MEETMHLQFHAQISQHPKKISGTLGSTWPDSSFSSLMEFKNRTWMEQDYNDTLSMNDTETKIIKNFSEFIEIPYMAPQQEKIIKIHHICTQICQF